MKSNVLTTYDPKQPMVWAARDIKTGEYFHGKSRWSSGWGALADARFFSERGHVTLSLGKRRFETGEIERVGFHLVEAINADTTVGKTKQPLIPQPLPELKKILEAKL